MISGRADLNTKFRDVVFPSSDLSDWTDAV